MSDRQVINIIFFLLLILLQSILWFGEGGILPTQKMAQEVKIQQQENNTLRARNELLKLDIEDLRSGSESVEELARAELGMVRKGETFFQLVGY